MSRRPNSPTITAPTEAEVSAFLALFVGMPAERVRRVVERLLAQIEKDGRGER